MLEISLQASKVLSLCCKVLWLCIECHPGSPIGDEFIKFVNEACTRSALILDILYQVDIHKARKKTISILKNWCAGNDQFGGLASPMPVVKQWVKVLYKAFCFMCLVVLPEFILLYLLLYGMLSRSNVNVQSKWMRKVVPLPCTLFYHPQQSFQ